MTFEEAMENLANAAWLAVKAAENEDGAPVDALRYLAKDADSLWCYRMTADEFAKAQALYRGAKLAGLTA